ncbi:hypothetical protein BJX64DRAFT_187820 [Aspergillus heterothallicus]
MVGLPTLAVEHPRIVHVRFLDLSAVLAVIFSKRKTFLLGETRDKRVFNALMRKVAYCIVQASFFLLSHDSSSSIATLLSRQMRLEWRTGDASIISTSPTGLIVDNNESFYVLAASCLQPPRVLMLGNTVVWMEQEENPKKGAVVPPIWNKDPGTKSQELHSYLPQ